MVERDIVYPTLFEGKKKGFAEELGKKLLEIEHLPHPDCTIYSPTGKSYSHSMESLMALQKEAMRLPHSAQRIVLIIDEADKMPLIASQTLLKILEEPPKTTLFVLIAESRHKLLPTILSRCQIVPIGSDKRSGAIVEPLLAFLAKGPLISLFKMQELLEPLVASLEEEEGRQETIALFFSTLLAWYRDLELLALDRNSSYLLLPEKKEEMLAHLEKKMPLSLEKIFKIVEHAKISFERFTAPKQILESLFIELGVLT